MEINERELMLIESLRRIACADYPDSREEMIDYAVGVLQEWREESGYEAYPAPSEEVKKKLNKFSGMVSSGKTYNQSN